MDFSDFSLKVYDAVSTDNKTKLLFLLNENKELVSNVLDPSLSGFYYLHEACKDGFEEIALVLVSRGANLNLYKDHEGTPLAVCCTHNHKSLVDILLLEGAEIGTNVFDRHSPLHIATFYGHVDMIDTLLERRPEMGSNMDWCSCMLYVACKGGHLPAVKKWVDLANQQKIDLKQPLQIVSESDDEECPSHERTPLYAACLAGHPDVADYLMYHDAEVTPFIAAKFEHFIKDLLYMPRYVQENKVQNQENEGNESDDEVVTMIFNLNMSKNGDDAIYVCK